jgi:hypothetical protein
MVLVRKASARLHLAIYQVEVRLRGVIFDRPVGVLGRKGRQSVQAFANSG